MADQTVAETRIEHAADSKLTNVHITISATSMSSFESVLQSISTQSKMTILAEGVPFHSTLTKEQVDRLGHEIQFGQSVPLMDTLNHVAAAYDYDVELSPEHTLLLRKRYTDQADQPCVTYGEIVHFLKSIQQIVDTHVSLPPTSLNVYAAKFYDTLSPDQIKAAADDGIAIANLTPDQRDIAVAAAEQAGLASKIENSGGLLEELLSLKKPTTSFAWIDRFGKNTFGYQFIFAPREMTVTVPLSIRLLTQAGPASKGMEPQTDIITPTSTDRTLATGMLANRLQSTITIGEYAKRLQSIAPGSLHLQCDEVVTDKPFSLFGEDYISREKVIRSIVNLYGLRLLVPKEKEFNILLPEPHSTTSPTEIPSEIQRIMPLPISRSLATRTSYFTEQDLQVEQALPLQADEINAPLEYTRRMQARKAASAGFEKAIDSFYAPAVGRLLVLATPSMPSPESPSVPVSSVNPEALRLIAIARLSGRSLHEIMALVNLKISPILNDLSHAYIRTFVNKRLIFMMFGDGHKDVYGHLAGQINFAASRPQSQVVAPAKQ